MRYFTKQIKWAYQRVRYGYDDRIYWQFDSYFIQIIPALKKFCESKGYVMNKELNPRRHYIYMETIRLIKEWEVANAFDDNYSFEKEDEALKALAEYFGKNITIYWD